MKSTKTLVIALAVALGIAGCVPGTMLRPTAMGSAAEIEGVFTLIFYQTHSYGLDGVVILDREDDGVQLVPYTPEFNYRTYGGLSAGDANELALQLLGKYRKLKRISAKRITATGGSTVGYELSPNYFRYYSETTIYYVTYFQSEGGRILVEFRTAGAGGPP